ncbi:MAG TPA: glycosyltransferase [Longimicrobiaceae bacterium]|nr:glycosyltransferase [Longimicrobiaceae bacterium]
MQRISVVMPVRDCWHYLQETLDPVLAAVREYGNAELIIVDNGSTDGTYERLQERYGSAAAIYRLEGGTISAVRNLGAARSGGEYLCFLDADCLVEPTYLHSVRRAFELSGADAVGCRYALPPAPHWIEATWHELHASCADGDVHLLPAGNFAIRASAFRQVGGFDEALYTGEDAEICQRLLHRGFRIYQSHLVSAMHLGNPKTIRRFFRRDVWYALGMFGTVTLRSVDKPTAMMLLHLTATAAAVIAWAAVPLSGAAGVGLVVLSQLIAPSLTVAYRMSRGRRPRTHAGTSVQLLGRALFLYWVYYWARLKALQIIVLGGAGAYRK